MKEIVIYGDGALDKLTIDIEGLKVFEDELGELKAVYPYDRSIGGGHGTSLFGMHKNDLEGVIAVYEKGIMAVESDGNYIDMMACKYNAAMWRAVEREVKNERPQQRGMGER